MSIFEDTQVAFQAKSNQELKKAYWLFKAVDQNWLTDLSAWSLPWAVHLPGVKTLIKKTVFEHFCGGESLQKSQKTIDALYQSNVKSILDYSVEGKEEETAYDSCFQEIMRIIEKAKNNPKIPFVVFKPTGFGNIQLYTKVSNNESLTTQEQLAWERIQQRFHSVCQKAHDFNVTLMVDAEESWMQKAADDLVVTMMQQFNQEKCIVVNTLQMYRHDRLAYLKQQYQMAKEKGYYIGYKVVRGAYMEKERERAKEMGYPSPIQPDKASTDRDYNAALAFIIEHQDSISLFAGTHNEYSSQILMDLMQKHNIPKGYHKIWFGQLLGMSDNISFVLGDLGYNIAKYVPYGPVEEVMPYLVRRAQENTSVAGQSSRELDLIEKELKRRKLK